MRNGLQACLIALAATSIFLPEHGAVAADEASRTLTVPTSPKAIEQARQAVDLLLAETLNDPMSAIQYRVSRPLSCAGLTTDPRATSSFCVCYQVNIRDKSGGYAGAKMDLARLESGKDGGFVASLAAFTPSKQPEYYSLCSAADLAKRKSNLIHALVD